MVVGIPEWISPEVFNSAVSKAEEKLGASPPTLRMEEIHEGKSVQIMHVGDYDGVGPLCKKLYGDFLPQTIWNQWVVTTKYI